MEVREAREARVAGSVETAVAAETATAPMVGSAAVQVPEMSRRDRLTQYPRSSAISTTRRI
jgi:hypothetical protein